MDFADEFVNMKRELRDLKTYVPRGSGQQGPPGEAATVTIGTTTTGAAGTNASVTNSGDEHNAIFNFTIPRGNTGATGSAATVAVGTTSTLPAGSSATVTNSGTSSAAVFNFGIPKGDTGATGSAATVAVGTTSTLPAGSSATVTNSGSSSAAVFNFGIPTGAQGPAGQNGQNGQDGQDGQDGYSPSATVTQTSTGATITITDKDGTTTANIYNGSGGSYTAGQNIDITADVISVERYITADNQTAIDPVQPSITSSMIQNSAITASKLNLSYSTSEQATGEKWIDGKTIYRKTINCGNLPSSGGKTVNHGITYSRIVKIEGIMQDTSGIAANMPFPGSDTNPAGFVQVGITTSVVSIGVGMDRSAYTGYVTLYYTKP